jgi:hypothetical protein
MVKAAASTQIERGRTGDDHSGRRFGVGFQVVELRGGESHHRIAIGTADYGPKVLRLIKGKTQSAGIPDGPLDGHRRTTLRELSGCVRVIRAADESYPQVRAPCAQRHPASQDQQRHGRDRAAPEKTIDVHLSPQFSDDQRSERIRIFREIICAQFIS